MSRFCPLFSSSSGNATYIGAGSSGILIDAGVSAKRLKLSLAQRDIAPESIQAIFVTHEHTDHIQGVRVFASAHGTPVYATRGTLDAMEEKGVINGKFPVFEVSEKGDEVGGMLINHFLTPHDSEESCGFTVLMPDERKIAVATDMGHVNDEILSHLIGSDLVMIESNHDVGMLQNCQYPYYLKRRIRSKFGHLSNEECAEVAKMLIENNTTRLFLAHLSEQSNMPSLAYQANLCEIQTTGAVLDKDYLMSVNQKENTDGVVSF